MSAHSTPLLVTSSPCGCNLPIPEELEALLGPEQMLEVAKIRLRFALDVARLTAEALEDVSKLVDDRD